MIIILMLEYTFEKIVLLSFKLEVDLPFWSSRKWIPPASPISFSSFTFIYSLLSTLKHSNILTLHTAKNIYQNL